MLRIPTIKLIDAATEEIPLLKRLITEKAQPGRPLHILEAGCGQQWELRLDDVPCVLTGVDLDRAALHTRSTVTKDLDEAILGDLRNLSLPESAYDVIYSSFVLEHIRGAERVMENFVRWLKPGGLLILRLPDPQSVYGLLARLTPFWVHVAFRRYIAGDKNAGKPGFSPFPTAYDPIISRCELRAWCQRRGLSLRAEFGWNYRIARPGLATLIAQRGAENGPLPVARPFGRRSH